MISSHLLIYILLFATLYLVLTSLILLRNTRYFTALDAAGKRRQEGTPLISICIPARNEEANIRQCVQAACEQTYPATEVLVLDDESSDRTPQILEKLERKYPHRLRVIQGKPKPDEWLGKPWACRQLAEYSKGRFLLFIDADTRPDPILAERAVATMLNQALDFITVWPQQRMHTFWEKMLIPMIYHALLTLLPTHYVYRSPLWLPPPLQEKLSPLFAAACGQCMIFKQEAYNKIGGHQTVKNEIVEDVALAKKVKIAGLTMRMFHGLTSISCRMYTTEQEIEDGFRKNFLAGFNYNIPGFIGTGLIHLAVFIVPFVIAIYGFLYEHITLLLYALIPCLLIIMQRLVLARWFKWPALYGLLHPFAVLWFQKLAVLTLWDYITGHTVTWKERALKNARNS